MVRALTCCDTTSPLQYPRHRTRIAGRTRRCPCRSMRLKSTATRTPRTRPTGYAMQHHTSHQLNHTLNRSFPSAWASASRWRSRPHTRRPSLALPHLVNCSSHCRSFIVNYELEGRVCHNAHHIQPSRNSLQVFRGVCVEQLVEPIEPKQFSRDFVRQNWTQRRLVAHYLCKQSSLSQQRNLPGQAAVLHHWVRPSSMSHCRPTHAGARRALPALQT